MKKETNRHHFILDGSIMKSGGEPFTNEEVDQLTDDLLDFLESKKLSFGGTIGLMTEEEFNDLMK